MLPLDHPDRIQITFDDRRLVANAGLLLPVTLAQHLGLRELVDHHLDLGNAPGRANPGDKMLTLVASAELYGRVQRKLFADVAAGRSAASLKSDYIKKHGIPARMFNGVRVSLEGKVASVRESQRLQQDSLQRRIARAQRQVSDAAERGRWDQVHQKQRRLANLRHRLVGLEADIAEGLVRLCFGSRRLWRK